MVLRNDGFSLVELAIVLVVMGLIMGAVLKGQELIESAKLHMLARQISDIRNAASLFHAQYDALPGDFSRAQHYIDPATTSGNGDGIISGQGLEAHSEAVRFWEHLKLSGYLENVTESGGHPDFGQGVPTTRLGGGLTVTYNAFGDREHWLVVGSKNGLQGDGPLLTPKQALHLDQKLDDGHGERGCVRAKGEGCLTQEGTYRIAEKKPVCTLYVKLF